MAGFLDENGDQWAHCNGCGKHTRLSNLGYAPPTPKHKYGQDLCLSCINKLPQTELRRIKPAPDWVKQ